MKKNTKDDLEVISEEEKKYSQEIRDFERYWYLGHRFQYNSFAGYTNATFKSKTLNISKQGFREKEIQTKNIYKGVVPFIGIQVLAIMVVGFFPSIATWLPNLMF